MTDKLLTQQQLADELEVSQRTLALRAAGSVLGKRVVPVKRSNQ